MSRTTIGWMLAAVGASSLAVAGGRPTRQDLAAARRLVDRREAEAALTETRRPYVVLDLAGRRIQFRLMGMTVREIPLQEQGASGLVPARRGVATGGAESGVAILTLKEKEADPRLAPLTPEQIEAGADDENAADALPPETPLSYTLRFKQPVALRIVGSGSGEGGVGGLLAALGSFWGRLWDRGGRQAKG